MGPTATLGYAWHVHHEKLVEPLIEPLQNRIDYIKKDKPSTEQATRLRLMRPVKDEKAVEKLLKPAEKAWADYEVAMGQVAIAGSKAPGGKRYTEAEQAVEKTLKKALENAAPLYALHRAECEPDCPWNGRTIFPSRY